MPSPILYLFCGKIASGKSTAAKQVALSQKAVLLSEDHWLATLYPGEVTSLDDFQDRTSRIEALLGDHLIAILKSGTSLVLDFHANTRKRRAWMREIAETAGAKALLHYLDVPDDICKQRLRDRNAAGTHEYAASDAQFDQFSRYFQTPDESEGLSIKHHRLTGSGLPVE